MFNICVNKSMKFKSREMDAPLLSSWVQLYQITGNVFSYSGKNLKKAGTKK